MSSPGTHVCFAAVVCRPLLPLSTYAGSEKGLRKYPSLRHRYLEAQL